MSNQTLQSLGDAIFGDIDNNPFLNELYDNILYNYAITKFNLTDKRQMREIDVVSALRFADLLSKSTHAVNRDKHKMWAQEIIILLYSLYPDNSDVKFYAGSVFANTGNYQARKMIDSDFYGTTALERFFAEYQNDYLTIPAAPELRFFGAQKNAYDHLSDDHFSYSGPTSMGKSFLMRMYIKDQIQHGVKMNFALIVPTKALINEIYKQVIDEDLKNLLSEHNYKVVTAAGDIALEGKHNFILDKAIENALAFADQLSEIQDNDLNALARDITNEVHGDYYLAQIIKKGVAYHIGYLPAAIRMRIEDMFRRGKITTMFCTSTLLEGVNLPADNLFITDNKIFRKVMTPVDFRNLIGRVGRIRFNLYGNVFFVSQGEKLKQEDYVDLLKKEVPKQTLSIEAGPKSLTNAEKKYVVEALLQGNIELVKRNDAQSEEAYVMMRKFALILLRDIMQDNDSLVRREFSNLLTLKDEAKIREAFTDPFTEPDDDINTSVDQTKNLRAAIAMGLKYPDRVDGKFNYDDVLAFLEKLSRIFKWGKYEASTLGKPTLLRWYAVVLIQWMEGTGLSNIMKKALEYRQQHPDNFWVNRGQKEYYDDGLRHRNIVFADTLEVIDNIVLFSISNYFLRFSNEYKTIHQLKEFDNNWYEFVEYGTTNPITILLQRNGFSREVSTYIRNNKDEFIIEGLDGKWNLSTALLECSNTNARTEASSVRYNMPELFAEKI